MLLAQDFYWPCDELRIFRDCFELIKENVTGSYNQIPKAFNILGVSDWVVLSIQTASFYGLETIRFWDGERKKKTA